MLNNAWPNYVPGESRSNGNTGAKGQEARRTGELVYLPAISDPWTNRNIQLIQQCYAPVAVADLEFDRLNVASNKNGEWPVVRPELRAGQLVLRTLTVLNDDLSGKRVTVKWGSEDAFSCFRSWSYTSASTTRRTKKCEDRLQISREAGELCSGGAGLERWREEILRGQNGLQSGSLRIDRGSRPRHWMQPS